MHGWMHCFDCLHEVLRTACFIFHIFAHRLYSLFDLCRVSYVFSFVWHMKVLCLLRYGTLGDTLWLFLLGLQLVCVLCACFCFCFFSSFTWKNVVACPAIFVLYFLFHTEFYRWLIAFADLLYAHDVNLYPLTEFTVSLYRYVYHVLDRWYWIDFDQACERHRYPIILVVIAKMSSDQLQRDSLFFYHVHAMDCKSVQWIYGTFCNCYFLCQIFCISYVIY